MKDNVKSVPKGKYIYEFSDTLMHRSGQKIPHYGENNGDSKKIAYRPMYPNFTKSKSVPPGLCAPCCQRIPAEGTEIELDPKKQFNYFDPIKHKELQKIKDEWMTQTKDGMKIDFDKFEKLDDYRWKNEKKDALKNVFIDDITQFPHINDSKPKKCKNQKDDEEDRTTDSTSEERSQIDYKPSYNFPSQKNQLGYMNVYLQDFLKFDNKNICYKNKDDDDDGRKLKDDIFCLLRLGVEKNIKQSFLYLLSNVYEFYDKKKKMGKSKDVLPTKNINDFKKYFIKKFDNR